MAKRDDNQISFEGQTIITKGMEAVMHDSMIPYAEYVIMERALPRIEDGLKPVQRRILYTMLELGLTPDKPHRKSARIVGDCLGKYHPHGDTSVYDAMVRMAQEFNMQMPMVDGHGNFGSVDGDSAAAMRYTEARMTPVAMEMLRDLEKDTVKFSLNFDDTLKEPDLLHGLAPLCIPINKTGKQAKDFPKMVEAGFASDDQLIMFPAGLCSRRQNGVIRDLDWKKAFIVKSVEAHRDVVPIHFEGRNSNFFYNLANLCKVLGIKFNIAMLYLADEMLKNRHKTFTITIGKPIPWQTFDKTKTPAQWAQYVKDIVYKL